MIERWFPCAEVSANSNAGWGSGNQERNLFTWFAARPTVQAKAAVICSLLPWPDDEAEQRRLQDLVRSALTGRYAAWGDLRAEILRANNSECSVLDPFSGRGMIPLEAARLGLPAFGMDYSPVAVLASQLLTDYAFRDWSAEPALPFDRSDGRILDHRPRIVADVESMLNAVGDRWSASMAEYYPAVDGVQPWAYLWCMELPCQECERYFPLVGSLLLRSAGRTKRGADDSDKSQAFFIDVDSVNGTYWATVHPGAPRRAPTLTNAVGSDGRKVRGKSAVCPFCSHVHPLALHQRLAQEGRGRDALLVVVEADPAGGKFYRAPKEEEFQAVRDASEALAGESQFSPLLPAVPDEQIPLNNGATIRPALYGAKTYGDLMCDRQLLSFVRLAKTINTLSIDLLSAGISYSYVNALAGYASAAMVRKLRRSTKGAAHMTYTDGRTAGAGSIFVNESTIAFFHDFLETGLGEGSGSWHEIKSRTLQTLTDLATTSRDVTAAEISLGSAALLPFRDASVQTVVTDPPYDAMVYYSDSSDLFFAWLKRAMHAARPDLSITADPRGIQDKSDEIIVKEHGKSPGEHRDRRHYDTRISAAFAEMRRVVRKDGLVTIVFGHGEPEVWQRLLGAIQAAGLVMTGSWPAATEAGGSQGNANIKTTLTMSCRPAPTDRPIGRKGAVEAQIRDEVRRRYPDWERWGLAPADMLMAAAGPAMEVVGRYESVLDAKGEPVDIDTFLPLSRACVQDAMAVEVDHHPLETFDARTRFALWWVRLYGRQTQAKSELRWQSLASSMDIADVRDLVPEADKGVAFTAARAFRGHVTPEAAVIDIALALAAASEDGLASMGEVLAASGRSADDTYLWAAVKFLADRLPDADPDAIALTRVLRTREGISHAAKAIVTTDVARKQDRQREDAQLRLL